MKDVVSLVVRRPDANRILMLQRMPWYKNAYAWCVPGGVVEQGETPEQAALRELTEETGKQDVEERVYVGQLEDHDRGFRFHVFLIDVLDGVVCIEEEKCAGFGWFTPLEAKALDLLPCNAQIIDKALPHADINEQPDDRNTNAMLPGIGEVLIREGEKVVRRKVMYSDTHVLYQKDAKTMVRGEGEAGLRRA